MKRNNKTPAPSPFLLIRKKRVLIVDDESPTVELLQAWLEPEYVVFKAYDGEEGLQKAIEGKPDLIFLDVNMPRMNGFETLKRLKADSRTRHIPVIMLTAEAHTSSIVDAQEAMATDYAIKPIDMESLLPYVKRYI